MIEPELAFADLNDDMACASAYLQYVVCYLSKLFPQHYCLTIFLQTHQRGKVVEILLFWILE